MVAVKSHEADRFLARPQSHVFLYLVFGPDAGLVAERARAIVLRSVEDPKDPFQLLRLSGDDLSADPLRLADEANTIPLFGGRRAIWIEARGKGFLNAVEPLLGAPPLDCAIVIEAGALKKDAPLRKLCEREKNAAAIECYPDSAKDIDRLIDAEVAAANLSIAPDAKALLASLLGQDRLSTRSEIAKLVLYAHGEGEIRLDHVAAIVSDASSLLLDHAVNGAFQGDFSALESCARRAFAEAGDANQLLGAALRHALMLHRARLDVETGRDGREHDAAAPAPSFAGAWVRRTPAFEQQLRRWTSARLEQAIVVLSEAIGRARREPKLAEAAALRALWTLANAARAKNAPAQR
ncbi:DNA polymerase III subunit delta [Methylocapsa aurea]|uniref:DNA polymerase III subunit delta n=1 Tax=Methylocapsa aurea TaxID=663610 RepID=UPI00056D1929|nr:DNA polymerase III subunit delta [Methylocapsa aurea]